MLLSSLAIENFKNCEKATLAFSKGLVCFAGPNGAGKTNVLDAIHTLCTGKSHFNAVDQQLIRDGTDYFSLVGDFEKNGENESVRCVLVRGRKKVIKHNDETCARLVDHYGLFPVIMVAPDDMELIAGGSEERRKWMDSAISLIDKEYLNALIQYEKLLQQRNAGLRKIASEQGSQPTELIQTYNAMLVPLAETINKTRSAFCADFLTYFGDFYQRLSGNQEQVSLQYVSEMLGENLALLLHRSWRKDLALERTNTGPHRDDLDFQINSKPLKKFGSQGQQKTFLLALKLAQRDYVRSKTGQSALLLLDDVCERLDGHRLAVLFRLIQETDGQVFLTDTSSERIVSYIGLQTEANLFQVEQGKIAAA